MARVVAPTVVEYLPAAQLMQVLATVAATAVEYLPATQSRHVVATDAPTFVEYLPAAQLMQVLATVAATAVEYLPAAQLMQVLATVAATAVEYLPAPQSTHTEPASAYLPVGQFTQDVEIVDPDGDDLPAPQRLHAALPTVDLYFPALQITQDSPFAPENPALHRQLVIAGLALGACEFDGQFWHIPLAVPEN